LRRTFGPGDEFDFIWTSRGHPSLGSISLYDGKIGLKLFDTAYALNRGDC